jgi:hypothetical protein
MTDEQIIEVVRAHKEGKLIRAKAHGRSGSEWSYNMLHPSWNFADYDYEVKPEPKKPREFWINFYETTRKSSRYAIHESMKSANIGKGGDNSIPTIHVREVLE